MSIVEDKENYELPPMARALGMSMLEVRDRCCIVKVPYAEHLVGDPDTGVIHGGVITTALDNASGWAIREHKDWQDGVSMATLDIRIDYMRPAEPHQDLIIQSNCYKMSQNVAFVRAFAHQGNHDDPIATSVAAFMLGTANTAGKNL
jgi:uncharacterized protein (TIGR00369 family)